MPKVNCAVIGCSNSTYKLNKWKSRPCEIHGTTSRVNCGCEVPLRLFCFPSSLRNSRDRQRWVDLLKRETSSKGKWQPTKSDRVCSEHFVDKLPTKENPDPSINLGYDLKTNTKSRRRTLFRHPPPCKEDIPGPSTTVNSDPCPIETELFVNTGPPTQTINDVEMMSPQFLSPTSSEHSYAFTPSTRPCASCLDKSNLITSLVGKIKALTVTQKRSKAKARDSAFKKSSNFTWTKIKTDQKMNYYTGISSILLFNSIFMLLKPYLAKVRYWRGTKVARSWSRVRRSFRVSSTKVLTHRDELLLTLMRLRLGLQNEDLADRFGISTTVCSSTFITMIRLLSKLLGGALVVWLPREPIYQHMPEHFKKSGHSKCRVIIDCSEVFIERPKSLYSQAATWSDYKHHNTFKFLIGITPNGYITFISDAYPGRCSDRFVINDSGFYNGIEYGDEVMADRGFQIKEELMLYHATLTVPPGARVKSQMTAGECKKTSRVANLRIHVERAINRVKTYRILKNTLPITMSPHIDDIILTCAALCNIKPQLISTKTKLKTI